MTRWAMVADLRRCVGCQTCTAGCRHANATPPGVQWRRVLDVELREYPEVERAFVPVGCQHCDEPPCIGVCPTTATRKRADGIVTIDYDLCIGCAYCAVACPYQARFKTEHFTFAYGEAGANELQRQDEARRAVATKCTFCVERIDDGMARGLTPGVDAEASPACVNSCKLFAVPWSAPVLDTMNKRFMLDVEKERLENAPGFDQDRWPDMANLEWAADVHAFYGRAMYSAWSGGDGSPVLRRREPHPPRPGHAARRPGRATSPPMTQGLHKPRCASRWWAYGFVDVQTVELIWQAPAA